MQSSYDRLSVIAPRPVPARLSGRTYRVVRDDALAEREALDVLAHGGHDADALMAGDEGELQCGRAGSVGGPRLLNKTRDEGTIGGGVHTLAMNSPSWMCRSVPQTPHALTLIRMSLSRTTGRSVSMTEYSFGLE